jgi:hypothetical protein
MKVSELRIGNLLRDKVTKTELRVIKLTEQDIVTYVIDRSMFPLQDGWGIEPIPLTEERLMEFGAKELKPKRGVLKEFVLKTIRIEMSNNGNFYYKNSKLILESVHQLQNLYFALKGEELTFKQN